MVDYEFLEKIKARIDSASAEVRRLQKTNPKSDKLRSLEHKLRANIDAYEFNVWLSWRHLDVYPYRKTKADLVISSFSFNSNKRY